MSRDICLGQAPLDLLTPLSQGGLPDGASDLGTRAEPPSIAKSEMALIKPSMLFLNWEVGGGGGRGGSFSLSPRFLRGSGTSVLWE